MFLNLPLKCRNKHTKMCVFKALATVISADEWHPCLFLCLSCPSLCAAPWGTFPFRYNPVDTPASSHLPCTLLAACQGPAQSVPSPGKFLAHPLLVSLGFTEPGQLLHSMLWFSAVSSSHKRHTSLAATDHCQDHCPWCVHEQFIS